MHVLQAAQECRVDDDAKKLLNEIKSAEAVVFGAPIYFQQFNGQFRLFEDRLYSFMGMDLSLTGQLKLS